MVMRLVPQGILMNDGFDDILIGARAYNNWNGVVMSSLGARSWQEWIHCFIRFKWFQWF